MVKYLLAMQKTQVQSLGQKGNVYPVQYSCLENPIDRRAWQVTVHRVTKIQIGLSDQRVHSHTHTHTKTHIPSSKVSSLEKNRPWTFFINKNIDIKVNWLFIAHSLIFSYYFSWLSRVNHLRHQNVQMNNHVGLTLYNLIIQFWSAIHVLMT